MPYFPWRLILAFGALLFPFSTICGSAESQETQAGSVTWGISRVGDDPHGALVLNIVPDGLAEKTGLVPGDVITSIDGAPVTSSTELQDKLKKSQPYKPVRLVVQRHEARLQKILLFKTPGLIRWYAKAGCSCGITMCCTVTTSAGK